MSGSDADPAVLSDIAVLVGTDPAAATGRIRTLLERDPLNAEAYRLLAKALDADKHASGGSAIISRVGAGPALLRAAQALQADDLETAEIILRRHMLDQPGDVDALYLMAKLARALDFDREAEDLLRLALEIAPSFAPARIELAQLLDKRHLPLKACEELEPVLASEPDNPVAQALKAAALGRAGKLQEALCLYEEMLEHMPEEPKLWTTYGHFLKTVGRSDEGYQAMRRAVDVAPRDGEAWWNLSNLKTMAFDAQDVAAMQSALESGEATDHDRFHLHFALGKALEDAGAAAEAFDHYGRGNAIRRQSVPHRPEAVTADVDASVRFFSRQFFEERRGWGAAARDPIFVVGMPRAGSTLVEQILASHPQVEGTTELPDIPMIARELGRGTGQFFRSLLSLDVDASCRLGGEYLERTRVRRTTARPLFVDKMPNNWGHVPLIHLLLPNARIIDARRHPLACGFSNFKQLYVDGHSFSYDLSSIGRYYADYVRLMAHIDAVLPGRVHRVTHENLVDDTEAEVRRMLDYLELPFDSACLRFYETERAVRTPSSEQVRRPISREGVEAWRAFEPWLGPLKEALGAVLHSYPEAPGFPPR